MSNGWAASVARGNSQYAGFADAPIDAQRFEQARAEQRVAILATLARHHPDAHAIRCAVDVGDAQRAHLGHPQSGRVGRHQQRARAQIGGRLEQSRQFLAREDLRLTLRRVRVGNRDGLGRAAQHDVEEELQGAHGLVHGRVGQVPLGDPVQQPGLDLRAIEAVGTAVVVRGQLRHHRQVGLLRAPRQSAQHHRVDHLLT
jgi:hypothetical protein